MTKYLITLLLALLAFAAAPAVADDSDKWTVNTDDPAMMYAVVLNDSGALFGEYCYPDKHSCLWLISLSTECEKNHKYPVLANSDGGAVHLTIQCQGAIGNDDDKKYAYVFTDFDEINDLVKHAKRVGFALPLQSDRFRVVRFSLEGAASAIAEMRGKAADVMDKQQPGSSSKDETL